jgi:hypothetical protein
LRVRLELSLTPVPDTDILPGEIRGGTFEDLVFHLKPAGLLTQLGQFTLLVTGQPRGM